jgi:alpha-tubulin suppressor-like RCC1 family protein
MTAMPVRVKASPGGDALSNVVQVASGNSHTVALKADGTVWTWGANGNGQLGNGTTTDSSVPVQVMLAAGTPLTGATFVAAGGSSSYACVGKTVYAWGDDIDGQLGNTSLGMTGQAVTYPVQVSLPTTAYSGSVVLSAGQYHAVALQSLSEGSGGTAHVVKSVYAWGDNTYGQLGQGTASAGSSSATPLLVTLAATSATAVAAGAVHNLAIDAGGNVWAWGRNLYGESGQSTAGNVPTPTQVAGISNAIQISSKGISSYAITKTGSSSPVLYAWGQNGYGQLGTGTISTMGTLSGGTATPTEVEIPAPSGVTVSQVAAGDVYALALMSNGSVYAAGSNGLGELGSGDFGTPAEDVSPDFQLVQNVSGAMSVAAGGGSGFALTNDFKFVWEDTLTGIVPYWDFGSTSGIATTSEGYVGYYLNPAYRIVASLDLFQDGNRSLLLQNGSTGALTYIRLNGPNMVGGGPIPASPTYSPSEVVVGTMNINNSLAIVWQNTTTGEVDYWTLGLSAAGTPVCTGGGRIVAPGSYTWQVAAAYPAGGENWIIWHDITGDSTAGELIAQPVSTSGSYLQGSYRVYPYTVPVGWSLLVQDVNGDGNPDFIWHDNNGSPDAASGETYIWLMNGLVPTYQSSQQVLGIGSGQASIPTDYYIGAIL